MSSDIVIKLHDIAREVEQNVGIGEASKAIRELADKISDIMKGKVS